MKKLPQYFLANFMGLPREKRYAALRAFYLDGAGFWSYSAFEKSIPEILSVDAGMLGILPEISEQQLEKLIRQSCISGREIEFSSNFYVAKLLKKFAKDHNIIARQFEMQSASFRPGEYLKFWNNIVLQIDGKRVVLCVDPKIQGLTKAGQKIVGSLANSFVLDGTPLADFEVAIINFPKLSAPREHPVVRGVNVTFCSSNDFYSYDELRERYLETYIQFAQVIDDVQRDERKTGTNGPLL